MVDFTDLKRAGHSTTGRGWLTNPARRSALSILRPFLLQLTHSISALESTTARHWDLAPLRARADALEAQLNELSSRQQPVEAGKEELIRLARMIDGLHKDQLAVNHKLGRIEDDAEADRASVARIEQDMAGVQAELGRLGAGWESLASDSREMLATARGQDEALRGEVAELRKAIAMLRAEHAALLAAQDEVKARRGGSEKERSSALASGFSVLPHSRPFAVLGTSLVFHDGPYGRFVLRHPDLISDHIMAGAFWDGHLKPIIEQVGRTGGAAIDAGAYLGFHSVYMSRFFRTVHSFEPQTEMYRMLCANLLLNGCRNVNAYNAALYDQAGFIELADDAAQEIPVPHRDGEIDYDRIMNAAALTFRSPQPGGGGVRALVIDELGIEDVRLIKVDTQGSDLHVLRGARNTIERFRPHIVTECERELARLHGHQLDDYHRFFEEIGYAVEVLQEQSEGKQIDLLATPR